jgi:phosphatidylcholine synthase
VTLRTALAWAVHLYTACGAVLCAAALLAAGAGDFRRAWLLLFATIAIDATDGPLARAARARDALPSFDGRRLDDIVDYLCWVFAPAVLLVEAGLLPAWAAAAPLLASAYGFGQVAAKTDDHYYLGFPSYWSLLGFYCYEFETPTRVVVPLILAFSLLVFVPLRYPYPTRTRPLRPLTLALGAAWGVLLVALAARLPERPRLPLLLSLYYPAYYSLLTLYLWWRRHAGPGRATAQSAQEGRGVT